MWRYLHVHVWDCVTWWAFVQQVIISVCYDVVLGLLQALLGDGNMAAKHWAGALATAVNQNQCKVAEGLCRLLLPTGLFKHFVLLLPLLLSCNKDSILILYYYTTIVSLPVIWLGKLKKMNTCRRWDSVNWSNRFASSVIYKVLTHFNFFI